MSRCHPVPHSAISCFKPVLQQLLLAIHLIFFYLQGNFLVHSSPNTARYQQQRALSPDSLQAKCLGEQQDASQPPALCSSCAPPVGPPTGPSLLVTDIELRVLVLFFLEGFMDFKVHPCTDSTVWDPLTDT